MSSDLLKRAWQVRGLKPAERVVLTYMADIAREEHADSFWMSQSELAKIVELHVDTVKDARARLTSLGHLSRQVRRGAPTIYTVHPQESWGSETPQSRLRQEQSKGSETPRVMAMKETTKGSETPPTKGSETPRVRGHRPPNQGVIDPSITIITSKTSREPSHGARTRAGRLPEDWRPELFGSASIAGQIAASRGEPWLRRSFETFGNYWRAATGKFATKVDWQATWANWVIEQDRRDGSKGNAVGVYRPSRRSDEIDDAAAELGFRG